MHAETFGVMAVVGFSVSAVLAVVAAAYGATHHVRAVRDELTGRAAARAIEAMRTGSAPARIPFAPHGEVRPGVQSGSLHLRRVSGALAGSSATGDLAAFAESPSAVPTVREPAVAPGAPTASAAAGGPDSEAGTTLLQVPEADSEAGTTLLGAAASRSAADPAIPAHTGATVPGGASAHEGAAHAFSEAGTTVLDGPAGHAPVEVPSEDATTLLDNEEA